MLNLSTKTSLYSIGLKFFPDLRTAVFCCSLILAASGLQAQTQNCTLAAGSGGTLSTGSGTAYVGSMSPIITRTGESSGLGLVQYVFVNPNDQVFDSFSGKTGARILLANNSGRVDAGADLGLEDGDEFCVFSWSFSLPVLQAQIDSLYNSEFSGVACCLFAQATQGVDVCSLLQDFGILEGADLEDFNDLADFAIAYGIQATFPSIAFLVDSFINTIPPGAPCTPGVPMCYAASNSLCFTVDTGSSVGINGPYSSYGAEEWISALSLGPNPISEILNLSFNSRYEGQANLELLDLTGRLLHAQKLSLSPGENRHTLQIPRAPAGYYTMRLSSANWSVASPLLME